MLKKLVHCRVFAIVDIETTGGSPSNGAITEICILQYDGEQLVDRFQTLIQPEQAIPSYITALTGISDELVADAPRFSAVAEEVYQRLQDLVFVAHNASFDYSFLYHFLRQEGWNWRAKKLCTVRVGRKLFPQLPSYSLGNLCQSLDIPLKDHHRAYGDAEATLELLKLYQQQPGWEDVLNQVAKSRAGGWQLPLAIAESTVDALPEYPGVYQFFDVAGKRLYVGKAKQVKQRVRSHFQGMDSSTRRQEWMQRITRIDVIPCRTELEALIRESMLIQRYWPPYNVSQKQPRRYFGIYRFTDQRGYTCLALERYRAQLPAVWTGFQEAEGWTVLRQLVQDYSLHPALCGLDVQPKDALYWQGFSAPDEYNSVVEEAVSSYQRSLPTYLLVVAPATAEEGALVLLMDGGCLSSMGNWPLDEPFPTDVVTAKANLPAVMETAWMRSYCIHMAQKNPAACMPLKTDVARTAGFDF